MNALGGGGGYERRSMKGELLIVIFQYHISSYVQEACTSFDIFQSVMLFYRH